MLERNGGFLGLPWQIWVVVASCLSTTLSCSPDSPIAESEIGHIINIIADQNMVVISCPTDIDPKKVRVQWSGYGGPSHDYMRATIYDESGYRAMPHTYGENWFCVFYDNQLIASFEQHKSNNWHYHRYEFIVSTVDKVLRIEGKAIGPDSYTFGPREPDAGACR